MRVTVLGLGAIGGWLAAGFAAGGAEVALLARGATLAALRRDGLVLRAGDAARVFRLPAAEDPADLPVPDVLVLGLKGQDLPAALPLVRAAMGPATRVLSAQNGVPWFFLQGFGGPLAGAALDSVDPGGALAAALPANRVLAAVVHAAAMTEAPGVIRLVKADRLPIGHFGDAGLLDRVVGVLRAGGVPAEPSAAIREEIWRKLWGNSNMNPLSVLCRATLSDMLDEPGVKGLAEAMMAEMDALGQRIGLPPLGSIEARMVVTRRIGAFRTSMLQDWEAGRRLELGPILGALVEMAERLGQPAPVMRGVHGLVALLQQSRG
ncbi:2-dehydropantoate 2-reductase [Falsiroseomonas oryzae]|uniref:2-dehydropantoate 2-reductase n=1 Tax=Falsiroseomonas oryzae TaxID=2766473 RepID=UPI0022EB41B1|nr:2-dehydropantoate 2-reductase [Roseomonas sp. MO-31]